MSWNMEKVSGPWGFTEGPQWTGSALLFVDMATHRVMRFDPLTGETDVLYEGTNNGNGLLWTEAGQLLCCESGARRISLISFTENRADTIVDNFEGKLLNSPNDLVMDGQGRIWFTDPRYGQDRDDMELDHESIFRLTPHGDHSHIERMTFDTTRPNGLAFSPDGKTLYVAQSDYSEGRKRELRAYPVLEDGTLGEHRVLHNFAPARGADGLKVTADGLILAAAGWTTDGPGPLIYVFEDSGRVVETHPLEGDFPTNLCFGGEGLTDLYITAGSGYLYRVRDCGYTGVAP
jgi:gluconolactonase